MLSKNIAVVATNHNPDDNRVFFKQVISLTNNGYHVYYFAPNCSHMSGPNITPIPLVKYDSLIKRLSQMNFIIKKMRELDCSILHFHDVELIYLGIKAKRKLGVKVVYDVHEDYRLQMLSKHYLKKVIRKPLSRYIASLETKADKMFDAIVTADNFVFKYFENKNKIILYNFPKLNAINKTNQISDISLRKDFDIIFPGSMSIFTCNMMIDITKRCHERGYKIKCAMISPFHFQGGKDEVYNLIKKSNIDSSYFFIHDRVPTEEVQKYLSQSKIGIIPLPKNLKLQHNIPTKLFEYMYSFLPVVACDFPPTSQFMKDEDFGFMCPYDDVDCFSKCIIELLSNPEAANIKGENGHRLVKSLYNWENEEKKLINLYKELLGS